MTRTADVETSAPAGATSPSPDAEENGALRRRRRLGWPWLAGIAVVVVVALVLGIVALSGGGDSTSVNAAATRTATVTRRDLVARLSFDGTLGYVNPVTISARGTSTASTSSSAASGRGGSASTAASSASSSGTSTVTSIAPEGQVVTQGQPLFSLDGEPAILLYGATPAYRQLSTSSTPGPDIQQLESDLVQLGYHPGTVDDTFTSQTASAVKSWEQDLGRATADGTVELGEVVFASGPVRVGTHNAEVGDTVATGGAVLQITSTTHDVTVNLDASRQNLVNPGDKALVTFPDGSNVEGLIFSVGKVATSSSSSSANSTGGTQGSGASAATTTATVPVMVLFPAGAKIPDLDQAPVTVGVTQQEQTNALAVPVTALLALSEGGYGLEVVQPSGATRIIAVKVGVYADGYVEVSGPGVSQGTKVVTA